MDTPSVDNAAENFLSAAEQHGRDSDPDHEVGDLQEGLRFLWETATPETRRAFVDNFAELFETEGVDPLAPIKETVPA